MMRTYNYDVLEVVKNRWSPRAFSSEKMPHEDIEAILEAARYAPSCFNAQPWRFIIANEEEDLKILRSFLMDSNYTWAKAAPVLILVLTKNIFDHNQKVNHYAKFDTGAAWGILSLEAVSRGYQTHAMAGFHHQQARDELNIPEEYDLTAMIALGKPGSLEYLDKQFHPREKPNTRIKLEEIMLTIQEFKE